jgi:hypothetical protein
MRSQLPRGLILVPLAPPTPSLAIDLAWQSDGTAPVVTRLVDVAARVATDRGWLAGSEG